MFILMVGLSNGYWVLVTGYWLLVVAKRKSRFQRGYLILDAGRRSRFQAGMLVEDPDFKGDIVDNGPKRILFLKRRIFMRYYLTSFSSQLFIQT